MGQTPIDNRQRCNYFPRLRRAAQKLLPPNLYCGFDRRDVPRIAALCEGAQGSGIGRSRVEANSQNCLVSIAAGMLTYWLLKKFRWELLLRRTVRARSQFLNISRNRRGRFPSDKGCDHFPCYGASAALRFDGALSTQEDIRY